MDSNRFDLLTRQLATGVSRRQVLKGIVALAVGNFLAHFGVKQEPTAYAGTISTSAADGTLLLPYLAKVCTEAATCDKRDGFECGAYDDCYCFGSAEGDIRCGKRPSTCDVDFCTTSDDCAHLGPGYFCDTLESGCCDKGSPVKHQRCIAPCNSGCAPEKECGEKCCANGQTCADGQCVSDYDCELSAITLTTMRTALAALEGGATVADLTPQGCIKVYQEVANDEVIAKRITVGNDLVANWQLTGNQWIAERDGDRDHFVEWRRITTYGATEDDFETIETDYSPETRKPVRRTTITPQGDETHFVVEKVDAAGTLKVAEDYLTPRVQNSALSGDQLPNGIAGDQPQQTCEASPCNQADIKKRMEEALDYAAQCLPNFDQRGLDMYTASFDILSRRFTIRCAPIEGDTQANIGGWDNPRGRLVVTVDPTKYCALNGEQRAWLLYHEILHAALHSGHDPEVEKLPEEQRKQLDRVYGCMALCYNNKNDPTRCQCAQCFGTVTCDPVCAPFKADCGATCPCPAKNNEYYTSCSSCLADCPSGLGCFGYGYCDPVGQDSICNPPVTCP